MHVTVEPTILYFGTPVVLISSLNADGSANLAPMSSAWWLGQSAMLGMSARSQTVRPHHALPWGARPAKTTPWCLMAHAITRKGYEMYPLEPLVQEEHLFKKDTCVRIGSSRCNGAFDGVGSYEPERK